jgi:dienelactone hydrolase
MDVQAMVTLGFTQFEHRKGGRTRRVFATGSGPGVVLLHEVPGISESAAHFGRDLAAEGFTVWMPSLVDPERRPPDTLDGLAPFARACVAGEFALVSTKSTAPVTAWIRSVARRLHREVGGPGVGVIGMCLTGGFALASVLEPSVLAPVMCEPALPVRLLRPRAGRAPGVSPSDAITIGRRVDAEGVCVLGFRFTGDRKSRPERFERLRGLLGDNFVGVEIDSGPGTPFPPRAHSVFTKERAKEDEKKAIAPHLAHLLTFLRERLVEPEG